ncbi:MAG: barstar family protein [Gallionella sp.]|nr:barstar family protein [Gallionella sp.]
MQKDSPNLPLPQKERGQSFLPPQEERTEAAAPAQQLCNREAAGSYTLQCSVETLRGAVGEAGFALFDTDLKGVKGKQNLLNALAQAANFPPEFGANWDALADALCDLSWHGEAKGYVLLLRNVSDTFGLSANDREIAQDILADTVVYWRQRNKAFWIFFV